MISATESKPMTMEDYLSYSDRTDTRYELINGELVKMPTESFGNSNISKFLLFEFAKYVPIFLIAYNTEVEVSGRRATCRIPDLLIHSESLTALRGAAT